MRSVSSSLCLVSAIAAAGTPTFEVKGDSDAERARIAAIRCGGEATLVSPDAGAFFCAQFPGTDVTDALKEAELVVVGAITKVQTLPAEIYGDPTPGWGRATLKITRVLKGKRAGSVDFLFIGSTEAEHAEAPKPRVGQKGVFLLTRGGGAVRELMALSVLDVHAADAEATLRELLRGDACPAKPVGQCSSPGSVCPGANVNCTCESACGGGHEPPPGEEPKSFWVCRPSACAAAKAGAACSPDGLKCLGCWGTSPWTCSGGKWRYRQIAGPP
ncbi:MAG: hypothetical protein Q8L14_29715 [Myxococcales bacterium]|nr:hypothetical protein [Myxococcales bacterium]